MSEEKKEEAPKKKGGKLPIIAVVAIALAGGGFFMTKGKGEKKGPKKVELGEPVVLKEILVNLADGDTYLKTEIALQCDKEFDAKELEKDAPIINNAIILILKGKKPSQLKDLDGLRKLQREIAEKVNAALPKKEGEGDKEEKKSKKKKHSDEEADSSSDTPEESEFDSDTGPVRKVYFSSFATQ